MGEMREMRKAIEQYKDKEALGEARNFLASAKDVGGLKVITANLGAVQVPELRKMGDFLRDKQPNVVAVLTAINGEKSPSWPSAARKRSKPASRLATSLRPLPRCAAVPAAASPIPLWAAARTC